jgi:hypothetical protein
VTESSEIEAMKSAYEALHALDVDEQKRVLAWLTSKLGLNTTSVLQAPNPDGDTSEMTVKQFIKAKSPDDDVSRVIALAYHRINVSGEETFTSVDLTQAQVAAAIPRFNISRAISNAQRSGYITSAGKQGTLQITSLGESLVEAMPDRALMKQVRSQGTRRRKASTTGKKAARKVVKKARA